MGDRRTDRRKARGDRRGRITREGTPTAGEPVDGESGPSKPLTQASVATAPCEPSVGDIVEGRFTYRLEKRLGTGGFGSVYLAECLQASAIGPARKTDVPPVHVAVKVLGRARDRQAQSSLKRELAALLAIRAPNIPRLHDWCLDGEVAFSVVDHYPAGSLADAWPLIGQLEEEQTWRLMSDLLSALNAAHRASILHLDVKPSNVLLDGRGGYVLTDFGVSHASRMSRGLLHQGQIAVGLGTHGYRAPEQDSRAVQSFDLRTDLWGVGATAWALYTGIDLNRRADVLRRQEDGNIFGLQRLSDVKIHCPPPLEEVVMGMLYIDPSRRPGGTGEVLTQIRAIASGFGLDAQTVAASRREHADPEEIRAVIESLVDPLWASICRAPGFERYFVKFNDGEVLSDRGETAHHTFLLIQGSIEIERAGRIVDVEKREGTLMGAISTLTGAPRTVRMRARGTVWACIFNEAELEQLVTCNSSVAVRMIRTLATRIAEGPPRQAPDPTGATIDPASKR